MMYGKDRPGSAVDDKSGFRIDQDTSGEKEQYRTLQSERYKKHDSKLLFLFSFVIIIACYLGIYEFQWHEWAMLITYALIALIFGVMAFGYYYEFN